MQAFTERRALKVEIVVDVSKRSRVCSTIPLLSQTGLDGDVSELTGAVVSQQIVVGTIVRVVIGCWHLPGLIGRRVLAKPDIKVTVTVDIENANELAVDNQWHDDLRS